MLASLLSLNKIFIVHYCPDEYVERIGALLICTPISFVPPMYLILKNNDRSVHSKPKYGKTEPKNWLILVSLYFLGIFGFSVWL